MGLASVSRKNTTVSQTLATGSHGRKRKAIEEKGDEEEVEKYTRPKWILVHNTDISAQYRY